MLGKINEDFMLKNLETKNQFTELCIQADNAKELVDFSKKALQKMGCFIATIDTQMLDGKGIEEITTKGTPTKILIKAIKKVKLGSKNPKLWKASGGFAGISALYYLIFSTITTHGLVGGVVAGSTLLSAISFLNKEEVNVTLWIKAVGLTGKNTGRFKLFIAGETSKENQIAIDYLTETFAELKDHYSRYFMKYNSFKGLINPTINTSQLIKNSEELGNKIIELNESFQAGKTPDNDYHKKIINYEKQRANTLLMLELLPRFK